jgi:hypothetical protein
MKTLSPDLLTRSLGASLLLAAGLAAAQPATLIPGATGDAAVTDLVAGRPNLALASGGATAFSSSDLTPDYAAPRVNDGVADNSGNSWIPASTAGTEFVALKLAAAGAVGAVAWSGQTGYNGRSAGTWLVQYTTDPNPAAGSAWTDIGAYTYTEDTCASPMPRTCFSFTPVGNATAIRLLITTESCNIQAAVQELEIYEPLALTPTAVGDAAVAGAISGRPNFCLASSGGLAFSSSDLGPNYSAPDVNDGIIDNTGNSWIPANAVSGQFVGVAFAIPADIDSVVWSGQTGYNGRSGGAYSLEYSQDVTPGPASSWSAIGKYTYVEGGCAAPMPRSFFSFAVVSNVTGVRLVVATSCSIEMAVQELEAYGPLTIPPTITTQPVGGTFDQGSDITLSVVADGGTKFQWTKDGKEIAGATTSSYTISDASTNDAGSYRVLVSNSAGSVPSDPIDVVITPAPVFASYQDAVLSDNPIHYYPLDDASGIIVTDLGSLATGGGTNVGGVALGQPAVTSRLGKCAHFDGASGTLIDLGLFHPGDAVTLEAWMNQDLDAPATYNALVARWDGSYEMDVTGANAPNLVIRNVGNGFGIAAGATAARGQWHYLVGVFADGIVTIYVDGVKGSEQNIGGVLQDMGPSPDRVMVGATRNGVFNFKGFIDEVAIYDHGLTAAQIRGHYRASLPPSPPELNIQNAVLLTWPSFPAGYVVQAAPKVEGPYTPVTTIPTFTVGNTLQMTVPTTNTQQKFFRLAQP